MTVGLRPNVVVGGTVISDGVTASAHGLLEGSSGALFPVRLSLRLSRMLFGSPLTALDRLSPDVLDPEFDSGCVLDEVTLADVSITRP